MGANDKKHRQHWQQEIRNCMYQLNDDELLALFAAHPMEAERMRQCLKVLDIEEDEARDKQAQP